jgi:hypothetical protein
MKQKRCKQKAIFRRNTGENSCVASLNISGKTSIPSLEGMSHDLIIVGESGCHVSGIPANRSKIC